MSKEPEADTGWFLYTFVFSLLELFVSLAPMWSGHNLIFSFDLMSKFLVDMEALAAAGKPFQLEQMERLLRFLRFASRPPRFELSNASRCM